MERENIDKLYELIERIPATSRNREKIEEIKELINQERFKEAIDKVRDLGQNKIKIVGARDKVKKKNIENNEDDGRLFPKKLSNLHLENIFMGLLLTNPKSISRYYFLFEDCFFEDDKILNIYKSVLFTEGGSYTPEIAKQGFNFSKDSEEVYQLKYQLKKAVANEDYDMEKIYVELMKLFVLRKSYIGNPIKSIQQRIVDIIDYKLYDQMSVEEVESAVNQVTVTEKFKQSILNKDLTGFLEEGNNNLTNGLDLPFSILTEVFKGIRKGETMAYAMPSNSGKSRFAINIAAYTAFVNKKKVLMISNEMSEEKMKLCLITTILNNPELQKLHGQKLHKSENEILDFKFRPDNIEEAILDEDGFILKGEKETHREFIERLSKISTEFNRTIEATDWVNKQINNSIYFINITDHTNDELKKVIMNYYYKEKIEYVFYDTLKTDTANIGNGEEIKRTATILSNIAQNFGIFICSSLQLSETSTLPINLDINDLAVSRTVKEVLDTLCLIKQINRDTYENYEYSLKEVDTEFYDLKRYEDPDVRYYSCIVDKNRAGPKPKLVFRLNLAYNSWEELGYLRLKQNKDN
ncbi:MAG: DnaB-like helicase C-terminal domain-containing protein [Clostridia bacterium]